MIRMVYHQPGTAPASLHVEGSTGAKPPTIMLVRYNENSVDEMRCLDAEEAIRSLDSSRNNWINVDGLHDVETIRALANHFGLTALLIEDIITTQRAKTEETDKGVFAVTSMIYRDQETPNGVQMEQLSLFFRKGMLITFQSENGRDPFGGVRKRLNQNGTMLRKSGTDFLAYALLDTVIDHFFPVLEIIGNELEEIEQTLIRNPSRTTLRELFRNRRLLLEIRRIAWPLREVISHLVRDDIGGVGKQTRLYLRDCHDHIAQIIDICESFRDLTAGLMDIYHSSLAYRTNEIMRVLTLVSTFFIPLTFLAGVYGMNFHADSPWNMPELEWRYGYPAFWAVVLLTAGGMWYFFRKKKWL